MFPQTYGTRYYGKRFPIEVEQQLFADAECSAFVDYKRIFLAFLEAVTKCSAFFGPKVISKRLAGIVEGAAAVRKAVSFSLSAVCEATAAIAKHVVLSPIIAACENAAAIKKQVYKTLAVVALGLASIRKYRQLDFEFIGSFAPGDVVRINSKTLEVTLNDENALHLVGKNYFPMVRPGDRELIYADEEGNRMVRIKVQWRDRWI